MQKHLLHIIPLLAAAFFTSCVSEMDTPGNIRQGTFAIELAADSLVAEIETRASRELTDAEAADFQVTLTMDGETVWERKAFSDITQADRTQPLGEGYKVLAEDVTMTEAESANDGWGCLRYAGESDDFSIVANQVTHVNVPCRMANAGLCVVFEESFTSYFTDYAVTTDDLRALKFSNSENSSKTAYYNTDDDEQHSLDIAITASAGWDGTVRLRRTLTLKRGKIIRLHVKLNSDEPTEGNITLSITYNDEFDEGTSTEIILE